MRIFFFIFAFAFALTPALVSAQDTPAADSDEQVEDNPETGLAGAIVGGGLAAGLMVGATAITAHSMLDDCPGDLGSVLQCSFDAAGAILSLGAFAYAPAIALGTWGGGQMAGGRGRYDLTLLGSSIGNATGWAALALFALSDSDAVFAVGMALVPLLQLAGAVVAYELSARAEGADRDRRVGPVLSADRNGAVLGLAGVF